MPTATLFPAEPLDAEERMDYGGYHYEEHGGLELGGSNRPVSGSSLFHFE